MGHHQCHILFFMLLSFSLRSESWGWFSSSKETHSSDSSSPNKNNFRGSAAEFSIEGFNDGRGMKLIENAKKKLVASNSCWQNAYQHLFSGCSEILADNAKRSRLAWHLSDCFQRDSGRPPFAHCDPKSSMATCLTTLDDLAHKVYLEFYLETNSICHQLQAYAFKHETQRLVTELKRSAQYVEDKLDSMDEKSEQLLQNSKQIHDSLTSIDIHTQQVAQTAQNVENHVHIVLRHSESVHEQTKKIAVSQSQLEEGQGVMKKNLEDGMAMLKDSYNYLGQEIDKLKDEAIEIEKEVTKVGDAMSIKMTSLHDKAEDIGNMAGISLDKQQQVLDGQFMALKGLNSLSEIQSKAIEESSKTLQHFTEYGHRQHEELLQKQTQIQGLHDHLMESSKSILAAQESFESKQANMFDALDKLFALHNAMLLESRMMKAFFIYSILIFVIHMLTSTKQTYNVRPWLYIGLCATLFIEVAIIRFTNDNIEQQTWIINKLRLLYMVAAAVQLLYAICMYRDYEILNHRMLLTLMDRVNNMQMQKELLDVDSDDENWSQWIDADLSDDVNCLDDPSYVIPEEVEEKSCTSSSSIRYNLRQRNSCG
ncbi:PREDICTED: protein GAMETE EXPRESSED 1-like [Lupinus angustifolius]|uniref:protein GAMETE EXPRESSED 1-like n=1 Tax=Lupinus angustifolius TaxID=3871 RepID=UPI00092E992A|nr:PREDICTED: protein GAMETE EXPRESSED 1-like [Lupinus angustifolius]